MYKYKKITINSLTTIFILLTIIELCIFMFSKNNIFGVYYLIANLIIIFLLVPVAHNYNKYYSPARLSKLIIIIFLGLFTSYLLKPIILNNIGYIDNSKEYIDKIFVIQIILKGIIYFVLIAFTLLEFKLDKLLKQITTPTTDNKKKKNVKR